MKKLVVILLFLLTACTSIVSKEELICALDQRSQKDRSHINIIWYRGTKDGFHYLSHVYEMFGSKNYKIRSESLFIETTFELTSDSSKFVRISSISDKWLASRKNDEIWEREDKGVSVK